PGQAELVRPAELLRQGRDDLGGVLVLQPGHRLSSRYFFLAYFGSALARVRRVAPLRLAIRTLVPSSRYLTPNRVGRFVAGSIRATLDTWTGISLESRPPCGFRRFGVK